MVYSLLSIFNPLFDTVPSRLFDNLNCVFDIFLETIVPSGTPKPLTLSPVVIPALPLFKTSKLLGIPPTNSVHPPVATPTIVLYLSRL